MNRRNFHFFFIIGLLLNLLPGVTMAGEAPLQAGDSWTSPVLDMEFVYIPAGSFLMGSPADESGREEDERQHQVTITRPFYLGKYEVTRVEWHAVMGAEPWAGKPFDLEGERLPAIYVSWQDAQAFVQRLTAMDPDNHYRLPTEAEWEYAARAGSTGPFPGNLDELGWYANNSGNAPFDAMAQWHDDHQIRIQRILDNGGRYHPVGGKAPNPWGLYDIFGNLWEWVSDWYGDYPQGPVTDPVGPATAERRALRGGSWGLPAHYARSASRDSDPPDYTAPALGLRIVREIR